MEVEKIRFVGGFARAGAISAAEYYAAKPDPVSQFGAAIGGHMNDDHSEATLVRLFSQILFLVYSILLESMFTGILAKLILLNAGNGERTSWA